MSIRTFAVLGLLAVLSSPVCARADGKLSQDYILGADDVIEVTVPNFETLNKVLIVLPDGKIAFPGVGELHAAGKTPRALGAEIKAKLLETYNNVEVYVNVQQAHSQRVRIIGPLKTALPAPALTSTNVPQVTPLAYDLKPGWRLMDLIAVAGGLTAKPRMVTGKIVRSSGPVIVLDVLKAIRDPLGPANVTLQADDLVILEEKDAALNMVSVQGEVAKAGPVDLQDGMTVPLLISQAGDVKDSAALRKAFVQRGPQKLPLDLYPTLREGKADPAVAEFQLQPGDILNIPRIQDQFFVLGSVPKAGAYFFQEGRSNDIISALGAAGGAAPDGDGRHVRLLRRSADGKWDVRMLSLDDLLKKGRMTANLDLVPGDVLYVPGRKKSFQLTDVLSALTTFGYLGLRPF